MGESVTYYHLTLEVDTENIIDIEHYMYEMRFLPM